MVVDQKKGMASRPSMKFLKAVLLAVFLMFLCVEGYHLFRPMKRDEPKRCTSVEVAAQNIIVRVYDDPEYRCPDEYQESSPNWDGGVYIVKM